MAQHEAIVAAARSGEFDRYAAALLAPAEAREDLVALAAFAAELARIAPLTQREATMGAIRLQWWREALEKGAQASVTGNPVADAVTAAARRRGWPLATLLGIVDAHAHDGLADPFADDEEMLGTLTLGEGALFTLAARTISPAALEGTHPAEQAGIAYGLARQLAALPRLVARKHLPIPQSRLSEAGIALDSVLAGGLGPAVHSIVLQMAALARENLVLAQRSVAKLPRADRVAFLPLALVRPYLRCAARRQDGRPSVQEEPSRVSRMLRIAGMHVLGVT